MTPTFKLTALMLDPIERRVSVALAGEDVTITAQFPFHPEYDMPFGQVRELAEKRALELLACAPAPESV
jgi:hypothetical protein